MSALFLVSVFVGLALGSLFMWRGIERPNRNAPVADQFGRALPAERFGQLLPTGAATFFTFGAVGYQLAKRSSLGAAAVVGIALVAALAVAFLVLLTLTRWVVRGAHRSTEDPRYSLQGFPGRVLATIDSADSGAIAYEANGRSVTIRARSIDGSGIPSGAEVAIERLEEGIVYVELWSRVEERL